MASKKPISLAKERERARSAEQDTVLAGQATPEKSDEPFRILIEGSIQGILVTRKFELLFANQGFADVFGYVDPAELLSKKTMLALIEPEEHARVKGFTEARLRGESAPSIYEFQGLRKDGSLIWLEIRVGIVEWRGAPASLSTVIDISDRKHAEQLLRESEERFRGFAESATDWFWEMDADLRFSYISGRFEELTGVSAESRLGKTRRDLMDSVEGIFDSTASKEDWERHVADIEAHRPFRNFRHPRRLTDGVVKYVSISGKPVFDENGKFQGYRGTGADITEQTEAELALRNSAAELRRHRDRSEQASRAKSEFLANVSHELRTPLNAIIGFSDIMSKQLLGRANPEKYLDYANDIHDSAGHLLKLISDILDISTIEAGRHRLDRADVRFAEIADDCLGIVGEAARAREVGLAADLADDLPMLNADRPAIQKILLNLLSNAIEATPAGGEVTVGASGDDRSFTFHVTDTGIGIAADSLATITEPFERGRRDPYKSEGGTGLGLAITQSLVELHDGTMMIESEVGKGTRVTIRLLNAPD